MWHSGFADWIFPADVIHLLEVNYISVKFSDVHVKSCADLSLIVMHLAMPCAQERTENSFDKDKKYLGKYIYITRIG